ncbi:MAG TPA: type III pantothenate kinase [Alphaproteobacteria bacterium]
MLLAIDAGNTNTVFALYEGEAIKRIWRIQAVETRTADEYASWLKPLLEDAGSSFAQISDVIIGSVVPGANFHLKGFCEKYLKQVPMFVGQAGCIHDLTITFPNAHMVGADLIANVMAATKAYKGPMIVIDFGTATKFLVIDKNNAFTGCAIAPGINQSADALHRATAQLPKIDVVKPDKVIGTDTVGCMRSGIYWGYVSMVEGMCARIAAEMKEKPLLVVTGGLSPIFDGSINNVDKVDANLVIEGLRLYHAHNSKLKAA